jgi:hypothetical protein
MQDQHYLGAALLSAQFMQDHMVTSSGFLRDSFDVQKCQADTGPLQAFNTGMAIHSWSILADTSKDGQWWDL